jgi:hypothetical protein
VGALAVRRRRGRVGGLGPWRGVVRLPAARCGAGGVPLLRSRPRQHVWAHVRADGLWRARGAGGVEEEERGVAVPCCRAAGQRCLRCAAWSGATCGSGSICCRGGGDGGWFGRPWRRACRCGLCSGGMPNLRRFVVLLRQEGSLVVVVVVRPVCISGDGVPAEEEDAGAAAPGVQAFSSQQRRERVWPEATRREVLRCALLQWWWWWVAACCRVCSITASLADRRRRLWVR